MSKNPYAVGHLPAWQASSYTPVRDVVAPTGGNVRGRFPSIKARRMVSFEERPERDALYLFDCCPLVTDICEQPFSLRYVLDERVHRYTPDFALTLSNGTEVIVEIKPQETLQKPEIIQMFDVVRIAMEQQGHRFLILSSELIRQNPRFDNLKRLHPHLRSPIGREQLQSFSTFSNETFQGTKSISFSECVDHFGCRNVVLALIAHHILKVDYTKEIDDSTRVFLKNEEVDRALCDWL